MKTNKNNLMDICYKYDGEVLLGYRPKKWTVGEEALLKRHLEVCTHCQTWVMEMELFCEESEVVQNEKKIFVLQTEQRLLEITRKKHKQLIFKRLKWKMKNSLNQLNLQLLGFLTNFLKYKYVKISSATTMVLFMCLCLLYLSESVEENSHVISSVDTTKNSISIYNGEGISQGGVRPLLFSEDLLHVF